MTHHHIDHAGNVATLQTLSDATVWMHPRDAEEVRHGRALRPTIHNAPGWFNWLAARLAAMIIPKTIAPVQIDPHVTDGALIPFAGGLITLHIPGHSAGQIAVYWPAQQTLFVADAAVHRGKHLHMPPVLEDEYGARSQPCLPRALSLVNPLVWSRPGVFGASGPTCVSTICRNVRAAEVGV